MRRFITPVVLSFLLSSPALSQQAQNQPSVWSLFTFERLGNAVFSQLMMSARAFADIRYQAVQADLMSGQMGIVGLEVIPNLPGVAAGACVIRAQRATLRGAPLDQVDQMRVKVSLDNAVVDFDCLPAEARPMVGMVGITDIMIDRLDLMVDYNMPQGSATIEFEAGVNGLVRVIGDVDLDYISYRMDFETEESDPSAQLRSARLQIEDMGLAAQAERILPPEMREPATASAMVEQNLAAMLGGGAPLGPVQQQLVTDAGKVAAALAQGGTRIVLETNIQDAPLTVNEASLSDPTALITALAPRISNTPMALLSNIPRDILIAATKGKLADEDRLPVGRALITGIGAPRDRDLAAQILAPLSKEGNAEAGLLLAEAFQDINPDLAYRDALTAVATGRADGLALLDRLEDSLIFDVVMDIQSGAVPDALRAPDRFTTLAQMRSAARAHTTGLGAPRSYETAYFWASMAAAGGDSAAAALRDDLDERMRLRGLAEPWAVRTAKIERDVLLGWIKSDLAQKLQQQ